MILDVNRIDSKPVVIEEDVSFPHEKFKYTDPLVDILSCHVKVTAVNFNDYVEVNAQVVAEVKVISSYSLKPFTYIMHTHDNLHFGAVIEEGDEDIILYKGNEIHLDEYLFSLIKSSIPLCPKAKGEKLPESGEGYRVLTEDEFNKEDKERLDPRFDKLNDLDLD